VASTSRPRSSSIAVWLYHCFGLSLRDVELILAARGIIVRSERIREWESSGTIFISFLTIYEMCAILSMLRFS
jgi:hypothetical protein